MNTRHFVQIVLCSCVAVLPVGLLNASADTTPVAQNQLSADSDLMPIVKVGAVYPAQAKAQGIEGFVVIEFTVDASGATTNARVVSAEPAGIFETEALRAVARYKYKPRVVDGQAVAVSGIRNRITFELGGALAAEKERPRPAGLSAASYTGLAEAHDAIDAQDYPAAEQILADLRGMLGAMNANEAAQLHNLEGYLAFLLGDYPRAIRSYEQVVITSDGVPEGLYAMVLYTLAQLNFVVEDYPASLKYIRSWRDQAENPGPTPLIFMSQVYYQMKDYPSSIEHMELGLVEVDKRNMAVKENWWKLLAYLYFEEQRWHELVPVLESLNEHYPAPEYVERLRTVKERLARDA